MINALIEMESLESAVTAQAALNETNILDADSTRIMIYFSKLGEVKFQNNNSGGKDYKSERSISQSHSSMDLVHPMH